MLKVNLAFHCSSASMSILSPVIMCHSFSLLRKVGNSESPILKKTFLCHLNILVLHFTHQRAWKIKAMKVTNGQETSRGQGYLQQPSLQGNCGLKAGSSQRLCSFLVNRDPRRSSSIQSQSTSFGTKEGFTSWLNCLLVTHQQCCKKKKKIHLDQMY